MSEEKIKHQRYTRKSKTQVDHNQQLANFVALAVKQDQVVWQIFSIFWPGNALLLVALFTTGGYPSKPVGLIISFLGFILSSLWTIIQSRSMAHLAYYEANIQRIEDYYLNIPRQIAISTYLNWQLFDVKQKKTYRIRKLMIIMGITSIVLWILAFVGFLIFYKETPEPKQILEIIIK